MTPTDLRVLCTALGFTAVVMRGEISPKADHADRAADLALLIEDFCRTTLPDVFDEAGKNEHKKQLDLIEEMAATLELCLECEGRLTWAAEHDARIVLRRARSIAGPADDDVFLQGDKRHA